MPGGYYHVHTRGNDGQAIFFGNWSGRLFVSELERATRRHGWRVFAHCLMTNHYHVVMQIGDAGLSNGMRDLNGRFAVQTNQTIKRKNHLFGARFTSHLIDSDDYLLESCRYTLLNPVRARMVDNPRHWRWSSLAPTLGIQRAPSWLDSEWILSHFGATPASGRRVFERFVADGIGRPLTVPGTVGERGR